MAAATPDPLEDTAFFRLFETGRYAVLELLLLLLLLLLLALPTLLSCSSGDALDDAFCCTSC